MYTTLVDPFHSPGYTRSVVWGANYPTGARWAIGTQSLRELSSAQLALWSPTRSDLPSDCAEKSRGKSRSVAYAMQWMGLSGVSRRVQMGCDLGTGLGLHSKHAVSPLTCTVTCPKYPATQGLSLSYNTRRSLITCSHSSTLTLTGHAHRGPISSAHAST